MIDKDPSQRKMPPTDPAAAEAAIKLLGSGTRNPNVTEAKVRAILVKHYRAAGMAIPEWLRGPGAREFSEDIRREGESDT